MLMPMSELSRDYGVRPKVIAHVGAHNGEEFDQYSRLEVVEVHWFEANPFQIEFLSNRFANMHSQILVPRAVWDSDNETLKFKVTSNSLSSSLFDLGTHSVKYPDIVPKEEIDVTTMRLDSYFYDKLKPDFINLDIQGAELKALKGAKEILNEVSFVYTEVSYEELYLNAPFADEIDSYLKSLGFKKVMSRKLPQDGWGDVLYLNTRKVRLPLSRSLARTRGNIRYLIQSKIYSTRLSIHSWRKIEKN